MPRKKKSSPKDSEKILELPFKALWDDVVKNDFPGLFLPLTSQVDLVDLVGFDYMDDETITKQNVDFFCDTLNLTIEIQGATSKGRNGAHTSYLGVRRDYYKQWMCGLGGYTHLEFDNKMCKDRELIHATIYAALNGVVPSPTGFDSWGRNKTIRNKNARQAKKLEKYLLGKSRLGTSSQIAASLKISVRAVKPIMLDNGWRQKSVQGKQIWIKEN